MPDTAKTVARGTEYSPDPKALIDPDTNIPLGTKLLGELQVRYEQRFPLSAGGYNAGPGAVDRWLRNQGQLPFDLWVETIPYDETRGYIKRVIASMGAYAWLYEPEVLPSLLHIPLDLPAQAAAKL
jgi:soluble lytic murein transglycosylase